MADARAERLNLAKQLSEQAHHFLTYQADEYSAHVRFHSENVSPFRREAVQEVLAAMHQAPLQPATAELSVQARMVAVLQDIQELSRTRRRLWSVERRAKPTTGAGADLLDRVSTRVAARLMMCKFSLSQTKAALDLELIQEQLMLHLG
jgi:hypothetical protein